MRNSIDGLGLPTQYQEVVNNIPNGIRGSQFVKVGYDWYRANYNTSASSMRGVNGKVFEGLVLTALNQAGIFPVYYQATVAHVPNVIYDILLYHPKQPTILSCKVSLRERWKQADLEGFALRQVYRGARSVLLTLSVNEGQRVQRQIENSDVLGLDECVVIQAEGDRFDSLIEELQLIRFVEASPIIPVTGRIMDSPIEEQNI